MANVPDFAAEAAGPGRNVARILLAVVAVVLLYFAYRELTAPVTRKVKNDQAVFVVQPDLPPPPPPPPPPPEPQQKPQPTDQQKSPVPQAVPSAAPNAPPQQVQMDAAPSAGAGGIAAGGGGGMGAPGSCIAGPCGNGGGGGATISQGFYASTLSSDLQTIIDRDRKLSRMVFDAKLFVTVSASGAVTGVEIVSRSGKSDVDQELLAALKGVTIPNAPPPGIKFPAAVKIRGRKPFS